MSVTVPYSAKLNGTTAATSVLALTGFNFAAGDTVLVMVAVPSANGAITSFTDNASPPNTYVLDHSAAGLYGSLDYYFYRKSNLVNVPTSLSITATTGTFSAVFEVIRASAMDASPFVSTIPLVFLNGGVSQATFDLSFTTTNTNDFAMLGISTSNGRTLSSATGGIAIVPSEATGTPTHLCYLADAGAAGVKNHQITFAANASARMLGVIYKAAKPIVTTTGNTVTEGTALRFSLSMASNPGAATDYGVEWGGTAVNGTDYNNDLTAATLSAGLSTVGGGIRFANGTTSGTIDVTTYDNALDQDDRTLILTVGGTASTGGLITDNDAPQSITITPVVTVDGGDSAVFDCVLSAVSGRTTYAHLTFIDGTKVGGVDFVNVITNQMLDSGVTTDGSNGVTIPPLTPSFRLTLPTTP